MEKKGKRILKDTFKGTEVSSLDVCNVISTGSLWGNEALRAKYDQMHKQGSTSWFSDGREERETILKMGEPWGGQTVLEVGCGEGDLTNMMNEAQSYAWGLDYSDIAIEKARSKYPNWYFIHGTTKSDAVKLPFDRLVMQGVLEHLDDPFTELQWMIEHFKPKTVITSSPCFLNPRGIVWMTLDMLGAVMSKTDLHYLNPYDFLRFCSRNKFGLKMESCDLSWGNGTEMVKDLRKRIPLALKDGKINYSLEKVIKFLKWLDLNTTLLGEPTGLGATMVYRIDL